MPTLKRTARRASVAFGAALLGATLAPAPAPAQDIGTAAVTDIGVSYNRAGTKVTVNAVHNGNKDTVCAIGLVKVIGPNQYVHGVKLVKSPKGTAKASFSDLAPGASYTASASCFDSEMVPTDEDNLALTEFLQPGPPPAGGGTPGVTGVELEVSDLDSKNRAVLTATFQSVEAKPQCLFTAEQEFLDGMGDPLGTTTYFGKAVTAKKTAEGYTAKVTTPPLPSGGTVTMSVLCFDTVTPADFGDQQAEESIPT